MSSRIGGTGDVGYKDSKGWLDATEAIVSLDQPDKAGAEHGVCGGEEGGTERVEGGEGFVNFELEV